MEVSQFSVFIDKDSHLTKRLVCVQERLDFPLFVLQLAILNGVLPIASLLLNVEVKTGRASDGL